MNLDRILLIMALVAGLFLAYVAGGISAYYKSPLSNWIFHAMEARSAMEARQRIINKVEKMQIFHREGATVTIHKETASDGYTVFTSERYPGATLVDMNGNTVHTWQKPFSKIWPSSSQVRRPISDKGIGWRDIHVYPDGSILAIFEAKGDTPYGYGLAKLDKEANVIWRYDGNAHHRLSVNPDGTIYALTHHVAKSPNIPNITFGNTEIFEDFVVILSADGKELDKLSLFDAFANSEYTDLLKAYVATERTKGDILHTNSVAPLTQEKAAAFPMFKPGQLLISMRNPSLIGVLDMPQRKFVWLAKGPWRRQHYAQFSDDGTIVLFDNQGKSKTQSRIVKYHPDTGKTDTFYEGNDDSRFFSSIRGMEQELDNGNMLIISSQQGTIFEVAKNQEIVWKFLNPFTGARQKRPLPILSGKRYTAQDLPFLEDLQKPAKSGAK